MVTTKLTARLIWPPTSVDFVATLVASMPAPPARSNRSMPAVLAVEPLDHIGGPVSDNRVNAEPHHVVDVSRAIHGPHVDEIAARVSSRHVSGIGDEHLQPGPGDPYAGR